MPTEDKRNDPILFYYSPIKESGDIAYINLILVINDKVSGRLLPEQYLAVAEKSARRIEKLNKFALDKVAKEIEKSPQRVFVVYLSPRMLKKANLPKVLNIVSGKESNVIFALEKLLLDSLGEKGREGVAALRERGVRIMLDGIEYSSIKSLADTQADIVRLDARLYNENNPLILKLIKTLCAEKGMQMIAKNVDKADKADYLRQNGLEFLEGRAIDTPKRYLKNLYRT